MASTFGSSGLVLVVAGAGTALAGLGGKALSSATGLPHFPDGVLMVGGGAVAALGVIRTAEKLYYAENSAYTAAITAGNIGNGVANLGSYIKTTDLDAKYFLNNAYSVSDAAGTASCDVTKSPDSGVSGSGNTPITLTQTGTLTNG